MYRYIVQIIVFFFPFYSTLHLSDKMAVQRQ